MIKHCNLFCTIFLCLKYFRGMTNKFLTNGKSTINLSFLVKTIHPFRGRSIDVDFCSFEQNHTVTGNKKVMKSHGSTL